MKGCLRSCLYEKDWRKVVFFLNLDGNNLLFIYTKKANKRKETNNRPINTLWWWFTYSDAWFSKSWESTEEEKASKTKNNLINKQSKVRTGPKIEKNIKLHHIPLWLFDYPLEELCAKIRPGLIFECGKKNDSGEKK